MENNEIKKEASLPRNITEWYRNQSIVQYTREYVAEQLKCIEDVFCKLNNKNSGFINDCICIVECIVDLKKHTKKDAETTMLIDTEYGHMCEKYRINPWREMINDSCNCNLIP